MFEWLRIRRARRLPFEELLDRWIMEGDVPDTVVIARTRASWEAAVFLLRERKSNLRSPKEVDRFLDVLSTLAAMDNPPADAVLELLQPFLEEPPSETVRSAAMKTLCWLRHPSAIPAMLERFGTESEEFLTFNFQHALGCMKAREAIPRLVKNARIQKSEWIRSSACDALGRIGGLEAVAHLRDLYEHERSDRVRLQAAIGLADNGETDILEFLEQTFVGSDSSLAKTVADHRLECGDINTLDRSLLRMKPHPEEWGQWVSMLQGHFPQMHQLRLDRLTDPPMGRYKPRVVRGSLRWLERHRPFLKWDPERKKYLTPHLPMPPEPRS